MYAKTINLYKNGLGCWIPVKGELILRGIQDGNAGLIILETTRAILHQRYATSNLEYYATASQQFPTKRTDVECRMLKLQVRDSPVSDIDKLTSTSTLLQSALQIPLAEIGSVKLLETLPVSVPSKWRLVVQRVLWVCEIENHSRVRFTAATVLEFLAEIDRTVEGNTAIVVDVDVLCLEICWNVDNTDLTCLHKVIGDDDVLLIRSDLNVVRANYGMDLIGIIEALDVAEVANVQSGNVVG